MKYQKPSDAELARVDEIRAIRQRHYDALANGDVTSGPVSNDLIVGKGPRGKFYVKRGKEIMSGPYETEAEARVGAV